jgi:hypothetical protein
MVCYARRAAWITILGIIVLVMLGADQTHLFNVVGLLLTLAIVLGGAITGAGLTVLAVRSVQRRRAATGACLTCQFRCQHALIPGQPQRMWLISTTDRGPQLIAAADRAGAGEPEKVFVPLPRIPVRAGSGPQWPDQPLITTVRSD